jgi:isopenicillin N synthase-like dioxygenase
MIKSFDAKKLVLNSAELVEGLRETGFAIIYNHGIKTEAFDLFYDEWRKFFGLPQELKERYLFTKESQSGFFPMGSEKAKDSKVADLKEFYHYYSSRSEDPTHGITHYMGYKLNNLGLKILVQISNGLPEEITSKLSEALPQMVLGSDQTLFRVIHYPAMPGTKVPEGAVRAAAHEDINLITLLPMATAEGLQVLHSDGSWLDVGGDPNAIVVNVGDMLQEATGGYLKSTTHRVVNTGMEKPRFSAPLFVHPRPDVVLSERHTAKTYLTERLRELGLL